MLKFYNSLSQKKEDFVTIRKKEVLLYVCGITPYDTTHLGHAFTYISFDILVRLLKYKGYKVNYTQNVTDINDRDNDILKKALEQNVSWKNISDFWTKKFLLDMNQLNWIKPTNFVMASEHLDSIVDLVNKLLSNGFAYKKNGSVYFDISKKKNFGKLSRLSRPEMIRIAKIFEEDTENPDKNNPLDIVLWKAALKNEPAHIPSFESPFGKGRPGWHIECSAMAIATLGEKIDIHGGGIDIIFPHHEAEIVQSEGVTGKAPFSRFWMHAGQVFYKRAKISKSLGNLVMISDLLKNYSANAIRWYLISHHYRQGFEFKEKDLEIAEKEFLEISKYINAQKSSSQIQDKNILNKFIEALDDDLNTPLAQKIIKQACEDKGSTETIKICLSLLGIII